VAEFWVKGGGQFGFCLADIWGLRRCFGPVLDNIWVLCKALGEFWSAPGIDLVDLRQTVLGQPWAIIPCGMLAKISAETKPDTAQSQFAIWVLTIKSVSSNQAQIFLIH